ncbi:MAG TPA: hypothetical protein VF041_12920 [Gemmatimonadaceae bacterium]
MPFERGIDSSRTPPPLGAVGRAIEAVIAGGTDAQLREEVARFAAAERALDHRPEEMLVTLKEELRRHAMPHLAQDAYRALAERVVQWAIAEYYEAR